MGQILHGCARATEAVRRAIQHSEKSLNELAEQYRINPKTVATWKKRTFANDAPMGPKEVRSTVLRWKKKPLLWPSRRPPSRNLRRDRQVSLNDPGLRSNGLAKIVKFAKSLHESIEHACLYALCWIDSQDSIKIHKKLLQIKPVTRVTLGEWTTRPCALDLPNSNPS